MRGRGVIWVGGPVATGAVRAPPCRGFALIMRCDKVVRPLCPAPLFINKPRSPRAVSVSPLSRGLHLPPAAPAGSWGAPSSNCGEGRSRGAAANQNQGGARGSPGLGQWEREGRGRRSPRDPRADRDRHKPRGQRCHRDHRDLHNPRGQRCHRPRRDPQIRWYPRDPAGPRNQPETDGDRGTPGLSRDPRPSGTR